MIKLSSISVIKDILTRHGFTFSKNLGQNFLINPSVCPRMADDGGVSEAVGVIEIGPGIGVLTVELCKRAKKVVAIELDERLKPVLSETLSSFENVTVLYGDVLKLDLHKIIDEHFSGLDVVVCANLPYYITSPIIMHLLESKLRLKSITIMVQKEAAIRLCAKVGTRVSGAVTVAVNFYSQVEKLFDVSRGSFMPAPNVDSTVIKLNLLEAPPIELKDTKKFFQTVRAAFSQRRKTVSNALSSGLGLPKETVTLMLERAEIKPTARAEELSLSQFAALANLL